MFEGSGNCTRRFVPLSSIVSHIQCQLVHLYALRQTDTARPYSN